MFQLAPRSPTVDFYLLSEATTPPNSMVLQEFVNVLAGTAGGQNAGTHHSTGADLGEKHVVARFGPPWRPWWRGSDRVVWDWESSCCSDRETHKHGVTVTQGTGHRPA